MQYGCDQPPLLGEALRDKPRKNCDGISYSETYLLLFFFFYLYEPVHQNSSRKLECKCLLLFLCRIGFKLDSLL